MELLIYTAIKVVLVKWAHGHERLRMTFVAMPYTIDSRYIAVLYNTKLHPAQQLRWEDFGQASSSRKTPMPRPNGRAMCVFRELFEKKCEREISGEHFTRSATDNLAVSAWIKYGADNVF